MAHGPLVLHKIIYCIYLSKLPWPVDLQHRILWRNISNYHYIVFSSPEPKAHRACRIGLEPASCPSMHGVSTLPNMNISETSGPIAIKFYLKHHLGGGY